MRGGRSPRGDRGSVTAEFAIALPAVLLVFAFLLSALQLGSTQLVAQDVAADVARSLGRGEPQHVAADRARQQLPGAHLAASHENGLVCVRLSAPAQGPAGSAGLDVAARACAWAGGG